MALKVYYESDADLDLLKGKKIAVIGYGSQGHAHALNLKESGLDVIVGPVRGLAARGEGRGRGPDRAEHADAAKAADIIMILMPDETQHEIYERDIKPNLTAGNTLMFAHGFNIHYGQIVPPKDVDVSMIAPKSPGHRVRDLYARANGVPGAGRRSPGRQRQRPAAGAGLRQGHRLGRAGIIETTFDEETETDLFGEQAVLCGGVSALVKAGFETLVEAGYQPEMAYFECLHELKLIVDLFYQGGLSLMRYSVSNTAEFGDYTPARASSPTRPVKAMREDPDRDPERHLRQQLDPRERGRRAALQREPRQGRRAPDREGRRRAPRDDAVHQTAALTMGRWV